MIDRSDVLWLGTDGSGVRKYDLRADGFQTARYQVNFQTDLLTQWLGVPSSLVVPNVQHNNPYQFRYTYDKMGSLWINVGSSDFYHINLNTRQPKK
ncbi:hypothetical protein AHMF7605_29260 [Adhaeribacter arboris]|uniref:Uncharacterized protein n=1 Tax=Adhaeribacter arboris TaxID=2072846 RepID=A0A2T2Y927_9BACT|nr:hypothetical protein AHMF7605_29260 [Adhaeribacter arboris]